MPECTKADPVGTQSLYPETAVDALAKWDAGESVFTVEMGGLGPGYEQCIHIMAFECIRAMKDVPAPGWEKGAPGWDAWWEMADAALRASDVVKKLGPSGAQAGAAKSLAGRACSMGWRAMLEDFKASGSDPDRIIQVSRGWPTP